MSAQGENLDHMVNINTFEMHTASKTSSFTILDKKSSRKIYDLFLHENICVLIRKASTKRF